MSQRRSADDSRPSFVDEPPAVHRGQSRGDLTRALGDTSAVFEGDYRAVDAQTLEYVRALRAGYSSRLLTSDGGVTGNPADFLIDASGRVVFAQYGKHYADSLEACDVVNAWRSAQRGAPAPNVALQLSTLSS